MKYNKQKVPDLYTTLYHLHHEKSIITAAELQNNL